MNMRTKGIGIGLAIVIVSTIGLLVWLGWPDRDRDRLSLPRLGEQDPRAKAPGTRPQDQESKPIPEVWPPRPPGRQLWALVAGVQHYEDPAIPPRPGLMQDARAVYRWIIGPAGWDEQNVLLLDDDGVDSPDQLADAEFKILKPNRYNLRWALQYWLNDDRVRPGDLILIYFAGQAIALPAAPNAPPGTPPRELLLPRDARLNDLARSPEQTGWGLEELLDRFAAKGEIPVICWLDVTPTRPRPSRIEIARNQNEANKANEANETNEAAAEPPWGDRLLHRLTRWPGVTAWLDAAPDESREGLAPGAFTATLIQSLGTEQEPAQLLESLTRLQADPALKARGFRSRGGVDSRLSLWKAEYRPLPSPSPSEPVLQRAHANPVIAIRFTADGQRMITAGREAAIKVWEGRQDDWRVRYVQPDHTNEITAMALGPDGRMLASADGDGLVLLRDLAAFERSISTGPPIEGHTGVVALAFSPTGQSFVSLHRNGLCRLWPVDRPAQGVRTIADSASAMVSAPPRSQARPEPGDPDRWAFVLAIEGEDNAGPVLRRFDTEGQPIGADLPGPGGGIAAGGLATDGQRLASIDTEGRLIVLEIAQDQPIYQADLKGEPRQIALSPSGRWLAVALRNMSRIDLIDLNLGLDTPPLPLSLDGDCRDLVFSTDERWLAAASAFGTLPAVWALNSGNSGATNQPEPEPLALETTGPGRDIPLQTLAFTPDNRSLLSGDDDGGLRTWHLPDGSPGQYLPPHRGQVDALAVSKDGRYLIQVTHDRLALLWDLREGRTVRALPGRWTSAAFLPAGLRVALTDHPGGDVVLLDLDAIDPKTGQPQARVLDRPTLGPNQEVDLVSKFGPLAVSADGLRVASGALDAPLACVWEIESGQVLHVVGPQGHFGPIASVDLSADGLLLLTAGRDDGQAKLWELVEGNQEPQERAVCERIDEQGDAISILAARLRPALDPNQDQNQAKTPAWQVALGLGDGRTLLWGPDTEEPIELGQRLFGAVEALTFTPEGRWLVASGIDKRLRAWRLDGPEPRTVRLGPPDPIDPEQIRTGPHHAEAIPALVAWPIAEMPIVASGSLDATIRLWRLDQGKLLGTLTAEQRGIEPEDAEPLRPMPWLAFTPFGHFDGSPDGDGLVHFVQDGRLVPPEQYPEPFRIFRLTDQLRKGQAPEPPGPLSTPPTIVLESPDGPLQGGREVALTIHALGDVQAEDIRLFQDGVPILAGPEDLAPHPSGGWVAKVRLRGQGDPNRFYSLAGQPGGFDGRSNEVELRYQGDDPEAPGLLHVLALGVSQYAVPSRALPYAKDDANQLSGTLRRISLQTDSRSEQQKAIDKEKGREPQILVLTDRDVTSAKVATAFQEIRKAIQGHPEDTVVVLLAGHADALLGSPTAGQDDPKASYFMILPEFPFPVGPGPINPAQAQTLLLEQRGRKDPETLLSFSEIYRHFLHLGARNRLVIVDACGAETIRQDARVQRLQELIDQGAYRSRTDYILASRKGEPAGEATALRQGLLTYTLLRGLGRDDLPEAPNVSIFETMPNADLNRNGYLTTDELRQYVEQALPELAREFPLMVQRSGVGGPVEPVRPEAEAEAQAEPKAEAEAEPLNQQLQIQAANASTGFTLFQLPTDASEIGTVAERNP